MTQQTFAIGGRSGGKLLESLRKLQDELEKNKVVCIPIQHVPENTFYIIDNEEVRKTMPYHSDRGKMVIYHPKHEELMRKIFPASYFEDYEKEKVK